MAHRSEPHVLVLLGLRLVGFGPAATVGELVGLPAGVVAAELEVAAGRGWVVRRDGRLSGWSLTPSGRAEGESLLAGELDATGTRERVHAAYREFLGLNAAVLEACTAWQVRPDNSINDHRDPAYDAGVVERLGALHASARHVCSQLGEALSRFDAYAPRLEHAIGRVRAGEGDWFAGARLPSYHSVWFELHENLLATLGIDRSREDRPPTQDATEVRHGPLR